MHLRVPLRLCTHSQQAPAVEVPMTSRMGRGKTTSRRRRKPLVDLTNALDKSSSPPPSSSSSSLPKHRCKFASSSFLRHPRVGQEGSGGSARNPSSGSAALALAFSRPPSGSTSVVGYGDMKVGEPSNIYHRRQMVAKRKCGMKALQLPPSSSSVERIESIGKKFDKTRDGDASPKSGFTRCKMREHPKLRRRDNPNSSLQDFIKQQQSYFAEIDAFELSEEEVAAAEASE